MSQVLVSKISAVRRKQTWVSMLTGVSAIIGVAVLTLAAIMLIDWWIELPYAARAIALVLLLCGVAYLAVRYIVWPVLFADDDEDIALAVERSEPRFNSRLISAIQFAYPGAIPAGASASMVHAMVRETEEIAEPIDFTNVVSIEPAMRVGAISALIVVLGITGFAYGGQPAIDLLKRALLTPGIEVPRKTRVKVISGDMVVARGDAVTLIAQAEGIVPDAGEVELEFASGTRARFSMESKPEHDHVFTRTIDNVQEPFTYRVYLNDGRSQPFKVDAQIRPAVSTIDVSQIYPAYAKLGTARQPLGDLTFLAGSEMGLKIKANKPVRATTERDHPRNEVRIQTADGNVVSQALVVESDRTTLSHGGMQLPAGATGFSIHLIDDFNLQSKDPAVYRVDIVPDKPPIVRVTSPERKEELVTRQATIIVGFDSSDDIAIGKISLVYRVITDVTTGTGEEQQTTQTIEPARTINLDLPQTPKSFRGYHEWKLATLSPPAREDTTLEWWIEVQDTNNVSGPGKVESEHFLARVVSESAKREELMSRLGDYLGRISNVNEEQQELNHDLGQMILEKKN